MSAHKSSSAFILGMSILVIGLFIVLIAFGYNKKELVKTANTKLESKQTKAKIIEPNYPPGPDLELNATKEEISALSDEEIEKQSKEFGDKMKENDLIHRLNREEVSDDERKSAKKMLVRLALLRIEKARRAGTR